MRFFEPYICAVIYPFFPTYEYNLHQIRFRNQPGHVYVARISNLGVMSFNMDYFHNVE